MGLKLHDERDKKCGSYTSIKVFLLEVSLGTSRKLGEGQEEGEETWGRVVC